MPASKHQPPRFKTIQTLKPNYAPVNITQYESLRTGMRVAVVDKKGPKVEGEFALATEITDNSGAPHTLEHLVFMGSKSFPHPALMDTLASRAFSTTNAGTATDYTSYSLKSAGWEGFSQILPIYLEHVVVPTLTDAACLTEVHHIDGTGHDAGVVYSEMQARENTSSDLMELQRRVLMYPDGSGFRSETGGMTKELRVLTAERIRAYHKEMYQPKNLRVIITGEFDHQDLLQIMDDFESTIVEDVPALEAPFRRPWIDSKPTPRLTENKVDKIYFPEDDESAGEITIGYLGPDCNDTLANAALYVLLDFFSYSSISVLEHTLVEREQLCSAVYYETETRPDVAIWFYLTSVETEKLQEVYERFLAVLRETVEKPLDMDYLQDCIKRQRRQFKEQAETTEDFFLQPILEDHLFSHRDGRDLKDIESLEELDVVAEWSETQWKERIARYFTDNHHVCVLGVPSKEMSKKNAKEEEARIEAQKKRLGPNGLKELSEKLQKAKADKEKPIPDSILEQFPVPSTESIHFIPTTTARSGYAREMGKLDNEAQRFIDKADDGSPLFMHFEHIPSNFVQIKLYFGTRALPTELRPLLSIYLANIFTTPIERDGKRIEFEDVVSELERDTVSYTAVSSSSNSQVLVLRFVSEPESYSTVIMRIRAILYNAILDPVRLHASLTKLLADIPWEKRSGESMATAVTNMIHWDRTSNRRAMNVLTNALYLKRLRKLLKSSPEAVTSKLQSIYSTLHRPENFRVYIAADLPKLPNPVSSWRAFTKDFDTSNPLEPLDDKKSTMSDKGKNPGSAAYIIPLAAIDTSFAVLTTVGPEGYNHPDLPALAVAIAYLRSVEGPLWTALRGSGLSYGFSMFRSSDIGRVQFWIYESPDSYKAFLAAREEIQSYITSPPRKDIKSLTLESARGELVYEMANEVATMQYAADESFSAQVMRGTGKEYKKELLSKIGHVGAEDIKAVIDRYIVNLFHPEKANLVVTCAASMEKKMVEGFGKEGFEVESRPLSWFEDDYEFEEPEGEIEDEEDDDDDDDDEEEEEEDGDDDDDEGEEEQDSNEGEDEE